MLLRSRQWSRPWCGLRRSLATLSDFEMRAATYWTSDRVAWLSNGRDDPLSPEKPGCAVLLRTLGLLTSDGVLGVDAQRKYRQLNGMYEQIELALAPSLRQPGHGPAAPRHHRRPRRCRHRSHAPVLGFACRPRSRSYS